MNIDEIWQAIDDQRGHTADMLEALDDDEWERPSLCEGWRVRDVAAHLTLQQMHVGDMAALALGHPRLLRAGSLNGFIRDAAVHRAALPPTELIRRIRDMIGSRRRNAFVTESETLTDALAHAQDMAIPLGHPMRMEKQAAAFAASRRWNTRHSRMAQVFDRRPLDDLMLVASDVDWHGGNGLRVEGPIRAHLLLLTGRSALLDELSGPGAERLRVSP